MAINSNFKPGSKNQTPLEMAVVAAGVSSLLIAAGVGAMAFFGFLRIEYPALIGLGFLVFLIDFAANFYFVRFFIFRRIKLIYKIIHRQKTPADFNSERIDMAAAVLDDVESEVGSWAENREKEIENLEKLAAYRRQYIGDISHELKTPIFSIQGFLHTLLDGGIDDPTINVQYLQRAAKNVERLQAIVEDLETISKLEAGERLLEIRDFEIRRLCEEVFDELELRANERKIRLIFKEGAAENWLVRADKESIRQVVINLVHNSIKYGREGGATKISFYDLENYLLIEVADNGIGIADGHLDHVFDRFYRVDKSRSREAGGTGLGLAIVKHIIEAHGQTINVRSTAGQGSTFGFTLEKA